MGEQDPNVQGVDDNQPPVPYVTAEMAWEMAKKAAAEAREEAIREVQYQPQPQVQTQSQLQPQTQDNMEVRNDRSPRRNRDNYDDRDRDDYDDRRSRRRRRDDDDDEQEDLVGFSPKLVKQLQTTVGVFNTLKDFASNPMQKAIEDRIGGLAAGIIEQAFTSPRGPPPKRDMVDTLLNSQMAFGLGQGLGSRAPELVESLSKSFGREKASNMIEGMIGKYAGEQPRRQEHMESDKGPSHESSQQSGPPKSEDQSNIELLLSLDPNNPEHVAAYSESQGGISIDVARKMLMIHQDDIIKRMESQGADTTIIKSQRGSRIGQDHPQDNYNTQIPPVSQREQTVPPPVSQVGQQPIVNPVQQVKQTINNPVRQPIIDEFPPDVTQDNMQFMENSQNNIPSENSQYAEYSDIGQKESSQNINPSNNGQSDNQQAEMMKSFAEDIGKVMGDVIGKIEGLNNTVFNLQNELNEIKKRAVQPSDAQYIEHPHVQKLQTTDSIPNNFDRELEEEARRAAQLMQGDTGKHYTSTRDFFPDDFARELEEGTTLVPQQSKEESTNVIPEKENIPPTRGFFPDKVQNIHDFERELEEETKRATANLVEKENIDKTADTIKEVVPIKKPIMSMVNKKKGGYSLKQKMENIEHKNDVNIINDKNTTSNGDSTSSVITTNNGDIVNNRDTENDGNVINDSNTEIDENVENNKDTENDDNISNSGETIDSGHVGNEENIIISKDTENDNNNN